MKPTKRQDNKKQLEETEPKKSENIGQDEIIRLKNQLARVLADYDNLKKRSEEERSVMYKMASVSFMTKLLPIIDNLRQAQNHINDSGIAIILGQIETLAKEEGFEEIKLKTGDTFNENLCEVIEVIETENEKDNNIICEIVLPGWKYSDGTVVRHTKVKAYKLKEKDKKNN